MTRLIQNQAASLVRERDRRRLRAMAGVLALGVIGVSGVLGYVGLQVHRVRVLYELEDLRSLQSDLEEQIRKLRLELLSLQSFARVESAARRLGFREPASDQIQTARDFAADAPEGQVQTAQAGVDPTRPVRDTR
jgi:cell division protein FtsL